MYEEKKSKWGDIIPKSRRNTLGTQQTSNNNIVDNELLERLSERINSTISGLNSNQSGVLDNLQDGYLPISTEQAISNQSLTDISDETIRQEIHNNFEDDGYFYADHEDEFQEELIRAQNEELEYEYENVLNGSMNTFGVEIEFINGDPNAIARELHELGICGSDRQTGYHSRTVDERLWKVERDGSLPSGGELVSPPLTDTPETWQTLEKVCEVAKRHGAKVSSHSTGGHIHMSSEPLDTAKYRWHRLLKSAGGFEDVIFRTSGGEIGEVRPEVRQYAKPFYTNALRALHNNFPIDNYENISDFARNASRLDRYQAVNLTNLYNSNKPNTVEFRTFNSSLEPKILQNNVKIANGIIFASEKARYSSSAESDTMKRRGEILKNQRIGSRNRENDLAVRNFVDVLFTRKKDKDSVLKLYAKNRWYNG